MRLAALLTIVFAVTFAVTTHAWGQAAAAPSSAPSGPSDAEIAKILDTNRPPFEKCIAELDAQYPEVSPAPSDQPPAASVAEAKARLDAAMKAVEDSTNRLKGEKACTVAFHGVVDPKLKAAGASPTRISQSVSKWLQAYWKKREAAASSK